MMKPNGVTAARTARYTSMTCSQVVATSMVSAKPPASKTFDCL